MHALALLVVASSEIGPVKMLGLVAGYVVVGAAAAIALLFVWSVARGKLDLKRFLSEKDGTPLLSLLLHPVNLIAAMIVFAVIALIFMAAVGLDRGHVLSGLSNYNFARGLITYLFAVGTIGVAVVLVVGALLGGEEMKDRFARAKEVLALLLGIFGTMVGFYYGSELAAKDRNVPTALRSEGMVVTPSKVGPGDRVAVGCLISGGQSPLDYVIRFGSELGSLDHHSVPPSGVIAELVTIPQATQTGNLDIVLVVHDQSKDSLEVKASVVVAAPGR